jgi:hypothetical protein
MPFSAAVVPRAPASLGIERGVSTGVTRVESRIAPTENGRRVGA